MLLLLLLLIWKMKPMQLFHVVVGANYESRMRSSKMYLFYLILFFFFLADSLLTVAAAVALLAVKEKKLFAAAHEISFGLKWNKMKKDNKKKAKKQCPVPHALRLQVKATNANRGDNFSFVGAVFSRHSRASHNPAAEDI